jgi:hypothetical protein
LIGALLANIIREQSIRCDPTDVDDHSVKKELDNHLKRLLEKLKDHGHSDKVKRFARYQLAEFNILHEENVVEKKKNLTLLKNILDEYENEMHKLSTKPETSEYRVAPEALSFSSKFKSSSSSSSSSSSKTKKKKSTKNEIEEETNGINPSSAINRAFGSECDIHRHHCERAYVKFSLDLEIMSNVEVLQRYHHMYDHSIKWFGEKNRHTMQVARKLGQHILKTVTDTSQVLYKFNDKITMNGEKLLEWGRDILLKASSNCINVKYRKKIAKEIQLIRTKHNELIENGQISKPAKKGEI